MRCIVCGRTEDEVAQISLEIAAQINKVLDITRNTEEIKPLLQRKTELDRITFTRTAISDEVFKILEKYVETEKSPNKYGYLICMHCKALLVDNTIWAVAPEIS